MDRWGNENYSKISNYDDDFSAEGQKNRTILNRKSLSKHLHLKTSTFRFSKPWNTYLYQTTEKWTNFWTNFFIYFIFILF